jgi:hypothetical protein
MALLDPPECFYSEVALNLVCNLLGWGAPAFAERIHVGASPFGDLVARKFVLFVSNLPCGLALPISSFFMLLLEELGLQPQHFTPTSSSRRSSLPTSMRCPWGRRFFHQRSDERVLRSDLPEVESELSCGSIFRVSFTSVPWYASMNWSSSNSMRWEAS